MAKYFKVKTNYLKTDTSNENGVSNVSEVRLFEAVDYVDAQVQATQKIKDEGLCGECDIEIQKVSYDTLLYRSPEGSFLLKNVKENQQKLIVDEKITDINDDTYWYEVKTIKSIEDEKGNEKYVTQKYLVEGEDLEDAIQVIKSYLNENDWYFVSIQETPIKEVILSNISIQ